MEEEEREKKRKADCEKSQEIGKRHWPRFIFINPERQRPTVITLHPDAIRQCEDMEECEFEDTGKGEKEKIYLGDKTNMGVGGEQKENLRQTLKCKK